jgi:spermidine synthase
VDRRARTTFSILVLMYFASGVVGLVDEVIFFKYFSLAFGATAHASSAVLVAFMAGLALGASLAARFDAPIARPLFVYGALEVAVGVACAVSPWLFAGVARAYVSLAAGGLPLAVLELLRGGLAGAVVLLPTSAMGATLPLVARVAGAQGDARRVARLYAANVGGGAVGSLIGVYAVIPTLGLAASLRAGACLSVAIGLAAMAIDRAAPPAARRNDERPTPEPSATSAPPQRLARGLMIASAASGLLVFASEVVFVHLLALVDGMSVYVFGLVLAVFLVALAEGAGRSSTLARRAGEHALAVSLALSGLVVAATIPVWEHLPGVFLLAAPLVPAWWQRELVRGLVAALAVGLPAACMGTTFPIVLGALSAYDDRGARIGRATAVNTVASIAGSLLGGFVLIPALGSQRACGAIALAYGVAALLVPAPTKRGIGAFVLATVALVVAIPRWNPTRLVSGANVYFDRSEARDPPIWMHEDVHGGIVTVTRTGNVTALWTNGKFQGDDNRQMLPQRAFGDVPAMFAPRFGRALAIGVGTGTTIGRLASYPFEAIEVAELSPGIVEAARSFFGAANGGALADPRVHLHFEDGRTLLAVDQEKFDLITVELSSIWFAGAANLYNREFYELAAQKLKAGGVLSQWIQLHHTTVREVATQMITARSVFSHAAFFLSGQGVLLLSAAPFKAHSPAAHDLDDLYLLDDTLDAFADEACSELGVARDALISTDDNLRLEYATPRNNTAFTANVIGAMAKWRTPEIAARIRENASGSERR